MLVYIYDSSQSPMPILLLSNRDETLGAVLCAVLLLLTHSLALLMLIYQLRVNALRVGRCLIAQAAAKELPSKAVFVHPRSFIGLRA